MKYIKNKTNNKNNLKVTGFNIRSSNVAIKLNSQKIVTKTINVDSMDDKILDIESFDDLKNIAIANSGNHEYYPSMVLNGRDCLVAFEGVYQGNTYIYLSKSSDYGQNWTDVPEKLTLKENSDELFVNSPSLCIKPFENEAYGVFLSSSINTGVIGALIIPDISEFGGISYFVLNFSIIPDGPGEYSSFWDFSCPDIVYHYKANAPWIIGYTGSTNYSNENGDYSSQDSLMFLYQDINDPDTVWLQWDHTIENCANLSLTIDKESKKFYGICEKKNDSNHSNQDLLFLKGTYEQQGSNPYLDIEYMNFSLDINHKHPRIIIKDDDIYIVTEINIGGITDDITIYHSSDEGENWDEIDPTGNITAPPGVFVPKFPLISANSTHIVCTLIEDKNLYLTQSNNSGLNWSDPIRINNAESSVVEDHRFADMPDNQHIVWTDERAANLDIYSISQGIPRLNLMIVPGSLVLNATKNPYFSTYNSVKFKVKNTGEDYAEDVLIEITINRTGQQTIYTKYPGFIKYLKSGAEVELKQPLFEMTLKGFVYAVSDLENIDYINVTIIPSSGFQDSDPSDNIESIDVTFEDIFPLLSQHPLLVTLFKLLALVL
ncbi:hypothetical protein AYK20_05950 [Thermoplasmatales archaeon SG8-52-1]|nr:MAG: hypothetical protein AYK20_05950 [Thermoplasmatales archaeon SG8-52-1]